MTAAHLRHMCAYLGRMFDDGPKDCGGKRSCINSACLDLWRE